ncbi:hypothetical protein ASD11_06525 [Aeromicrobium sp. Root495]|nr:hypothetical protein ASD11_06525 [Aeromicrobium sp. Root495]
MALGQLLNQVLPGNEVTTRPFLVHSGLDDKAELRSGTVQVTAVRGSRAKERLASDPLVTSGLFVRIDFTYVPHGKPSGLSYAELHDGSGRVTEAGPFGDRTTISCPATQTDIRQLCTATFEADPLTLPGSSVRIAVSPNDQRFDSMLVADLEISRSDVTQWRASSLALPAGVAVVEGLS